MNKIRTCVDSAEVAAVLMEVFSLLSLESENGRLLMYAGRCVCVSRMTRSWLCAPVVLGCESVSFYPEVCWQEGRGLQRVGWAGMSEEGGLTRLIILGHLFPSLSRPALFSSPPFTVVWVCLGGLADQCSLFAIALKTNQNSPFRYRERKSVSFREGRLLSFTFTFSFSFSFSFHSFILTSTASWHPSQDQHATCWPPPSGHPSPPARDSLPPRPRRLLQRTTTTTTTTTPLSSSPNRNIPQDSTVSASTTRALSRKT